MPEKPNDRPKPTTAAPKEKDVDPRIFVVVDGQKFPRPSLETFFAQAPADATPDASGCACHPVLLPVCTCNKVCSCVPVCSCDAHTTCSCVGHSSGGGTYCQCAPVH